MKLTDVPGARAPAATGLGPADAPSILDSAVEELGGLIHHLRRSAAHRWNPSELSMTHMHVLMLLDSAGTVPMNRVAEALLCSTPNATGIIDRMEERGLLERLRDDRDRRVVLVRATETGRQAMAEAESIRLQHLRHLLESLSAGEQRACLRAFRALRRAAERAEPSAVGRHAPHEDR